MENLNGKGIIQQPAYQRVSSWKPAVVAPPPPPPAKPKLLDRVRLAIRTRHYSFHTEKAYVGWMKRFIFFHNKRHPAEMGESEIGQFLSSLARDLRVSASTQNQALNALLFLYHEVLDKQIGLIQGVVRSPVDGLALPPDGYVL
jgi:hypothetical protein